VSYDNCAEFSAKAYCEGGVLDIIFGYGVSIDELPKEDSRLKEIVVEFIKLSGLYRELMDLLPEPTEYED
jgi:hypothetical protein